MGTLHTIHIFRDKINNSSIPILRYQRCLPQRVIFMHVNVNNNRYYILFNNNYIFFYLFLSLLQKAITKNSGIRLEDRSSVFTSVINSSPEGVETVIDFVRENHDKM